MKISSYMMEMGVKIDWETIITYPTRKIKGNFIELRHLGELSRKTTFFVTDDRVKHTFKTIKEVMSFIPTTKTYQARLEYEMAMQK